MQSQKQQIARKITLMRHELAELETALRVLQRLDGEEADLAPPPPSQAPVNGQAPSPVYQHDEVHDLGTKDLRGTTVIEAAAAVLRECGRAHFVEIAHMAHLRGYESESGFYSSAETFRRKLRDDRATFLNDGHGYFRLKPEDYEPPRTQGDLTGLSAPDAAAKVLIDAGPGGMDVDDIVAAAIERGFQHVDEHATIDRIRTTFREGMRRRKDLIEETLDGKFRVISANPSVRGRKAPGKGGLYRHVKANVVPRLPEIFTTDDLKRLVNEDFATRMQAIYNMVHQLEDDGLAEVVERSQGRRPAKYRKLLKEGSG